VISSPAAARLSARLFVTALCGCQSAPPSLALSPDAAGASVADGGPSLSDPTAAKDLCTSASVVFEIKSAPGTQYCAGNACSDDWFTVHPADGAATLNVQSGCRTDCASCTQKACPALCDPPSRVVSGGLRHGWDGTHFDDGTCGAGTSCTLPACAPAGRYIATMCAYKEIALDSGPCVGAEAATCVDVPFDWPPTNLGNTVQGIVGDSE